MPKVSLRAVGPTGRRLKCLKLKSQNRKHKEREVRKVPKMPKVGNRKKTEDRRQ